jgi:AraC-like DNA-binding protein
MQADIHTIFESDFYHILDFKCRCTDCRVSKPEYSESFCISFVRKGNFLFNVYRHSLDSYSGCALVTKPGYEHTVTHTHTIPDECTIFDFKQEFSNDLSRRYAETKFFRDNDLHSTLVKTSPEMEFLHYYILQLIQARAAGKLQIDNLVMEVIDKVLLRLTDYVPDAAVNARLKKNHLLTIERAKEYITRNFTKDISLMEIAEYSYVSPFHFSRIFKTFTSSSPHQFLLAIRLQHAAMLLQDTRQPIADVAYSSGFNSLEHFTSAFRRRFTLAPTRFRLGKRAPATKAL